MIARAVRRGPVPAVALVGPLVGALVLAACSGNATTWTATPAASAASQVPGTGSVDLTILGAASLKGALEAAKEAYEAANPGTALTISTDSSAALAVQVEQGAPADVFLSADTANPQRLAAAGLTAGEPVPFAGNELTIIVPADNPGGVTTPADLATPGLKIVAVGDAAPITRYATKLVDNLAALPGYPPDFAAAYARNVVSKEDNVKAVAAKIELGEGDAGIVYVTDAAASDGVATIAVPQEANVPATYAGVVVGASQHREAARAFLDWFAGPDGRAIIAAFGFLPPSQ